MRRPACAPELKSEWHTPISQRLRKRNPGQYLGRSLARWRKSVLSIRTCYQKHCGRGRWTRYLVNEATIEKAHVILKENPQGVLYLRDELSGWIAQLDQRGRERERAFFLESWDGEGDFTFDRVGRGTVYANHLCLSVFG